MIDQLCAQIQARLDELAGEAERLRGALVALGENAVKLPATVTRAGRGSDTARGPGRPAAAAGKAPAGTRGRGARAAASGRPAGSRRPARAAAGAAGGNGAVRAGAARTPPGATKAAVLAALAGGEAMTAGQVASKAGLERRTVSTTLGKLAKSGEVQKAERGYRRP